MTDNTVNTTRSTLFLSFLKISAAAAKKNVLKKAANRAEFEGGLEDLNYNRIEYLCLDFIRVDRSFVQIHTLGKDTMHVFVSTLYNSLIKLNTLLLPSRGYL